MRKNLFALAIAGILAVSTMAPTMVSAAGTTAPTPQEYQTPVSYKYKDPSLTFDGFTVTVPAALNLTSDAPEVVDKVTVKMDDGRTLPSDKAIKVEVKSKNGYKLNKEGSQADPTNDPTYALKTKKQTTENADGSNVDWGQGTTDPAANTNYTEIGKFVTGDFTPDNQNTKHTFIKANIVKKPQVGNDNVKFVDTLTFQVSVGNAGA